MDVRVLVAAAGPDGPPAGAPVVVEVRDTSRMDVASTTVAAGRAVCGDVPADATSADVGGLLGTDTPGRVVVAVVDLSLPDEAPDLRDLTVWARVATTDQEHVTSGDWITVQSYPVEPGTVVVEVVPI